MVRPTIFLDIDGVLADFCGAACALFGWPVETATRWDFFEANGVSVEQFWKVIDAEGPEFWANLEFLTTGERLLEQLQVVGDVYLCTSPSLHEHCYTGKRQWIRRHFGDRYTRSIFTAHKHLLAGPRRWLVDDSPTNIAKFRQAGGQVLLWPQLWNRPIGSSATTETRQEAVLARVSSYIC